MIPRWLKWVSGVLVVLVGGGALAWRLLHLSELSVIGAGYGAEQTCACLFISGRTLESCKTDLEPLAQKLVSFKIGDHEVTARSFGVATATAKHEPGFGCSLQD